MTQSSSIAVPSGITGSWSLDSKDTTIELHTKAMWGLAKVNATFRAESGSGLVGESGEISGELVVDANSVDSKMKKRDAHLRSADFFEVQKYPTFTFAASQVTPSADDTFTIQGSLRVKEQSLPVELATKVEVIDSDHLILHAETIIDRSNWGITWAKMGAGLVNHIVINAPFTRS
jgi:polyisoprenoid-binding protein YceI